MVVVVAALLAYRCHYLSKNKKAKEREGEEESFSASAEQYLEKAEAIGRTSSDFIARAALSCTHSDTTTGDTDRFFIDKTRSGSSVSSDSAQPLPNRNSGAARFRRVQNIRRRKSLRKMTSVSEKGVQGRDGTTHQVVATKREIPPVPVPVDIELFPHDVRQEWINSVFGSSFFPPNYDPDYSPPRQGMGLSKSGQYVSYEARIPPCCNGIDREGKLGVTLSNIALGLFVKRVDEGSEADAAGVEVGSLLVEINGIGMMAEPSAQALERLWQYEGLFESRDSEMTERNIPVVFLTFIKNGHLYTVVFTSKPPYGISWAPCGNFALVQKSYSHAQTAGVRRGCLVAAINDKSMRDFDHSGAASKLKELFQSEQAIRMSLVYTPATARASYYERSLEPDKVPRKKQSSSPRKQPLASQGGVEVRVHPLEYGLGSFLNSSFRQDGPTTTQRQGVASELALKVVAGELEAPTKRYLLGSDGNNASMRVCNSYAPCPVVEPTRMFEKWYQLDALGYLARFCSVSFNQDLFVQQRVPLDRKDPAAGLVTFLNESENPHLLVRCLLSQFISSLCVSKTINGEHVEEFEMNASYDAVARDTQLLIEWLLSLARGNDGFGQRFYFMLRTYVATLEEERKSSETEDASQNHLGLLQTLDILKSAEKHVSATLSCERKMPNANSSNESSLVRDELQTKASVSDDSGLSRETSPKKMGSKKKKSRLRSLYKKSSSKRQSLPIALREGIESRPSPQKIMPKYENPPPLVAPAQLFDNMNTFLGELDGICDSVGRSLLKSVSKKVTEWALQPWSSKKETALSNVTELMRDSLRKASMQQLQIVNPFDSKELFVSLDSRESWILPSAHFPLLLTFVTKEIQPDVMDKDTRQEEMLDTALKEECLHRTRVEILASSTKGGEKGSGNGERRFFVQGAVAGIMKESGRSAGTENDDAHVWERNNVLTFDSRSTWGGTPRTLTLRVSMVEISKGGQDQVVHTDDDGRLHYSSVVGCCWVDLKPMWRRLDEMKRQKRGGFSTVTCHAQVLPYDDAIAFDRHGELQPHHVSTKERMELHFRVTTECLDVEQSSGAFLSCKRMLLYKHDDDLRQDMFAIDFIRICDKILKASGLDMKLLTFDCMPVGTKRGFIEWLPGSVPLSDICAQGNSFLVSEDDDSRGSDSKHGLADTCEDDEVSISEMAKAGLMKYQYFRSPLKKDSSRGSFSNNPIQDYLRSSAYDSDAPYLIQKEVMDTYVKSCAGYCVLTYLLGVGDRHLDNLLLHQTGHFFHCDFSFILGNDPKKYLPMRITEDMIHGMGGRGSDNYAKFLSLAGAAFTTFRRHENVRVLLSLVRLMVPSNLPDLSRNRDPSEVLLALRDRLRLDLSDDKAVMFLEELIENSTSSKLWVAVDALHSLGKRF